jgi:hypothetical protein
MLELFLKLIDRFIDLGKRRQEINRSFFTDFVAPAMADFEAVHKDYLESFLRYRSMLEDQTIPLGPEHPVLTSIKKDNLFSEGLRAKILGLDPFLDDPVFGDFMLKVKLYLTEATTPPVLIIPNMQSTRNSYWRTLKEIVNSKDSDAEKRRDALRALDNTVRWLQRYYSDVVGEYAEMKKKLLKPI